MSDSRGGLDEDRLAVRTAEASERNPLEEKTGTGAGLYTEETQHRIVDCME